MQPRRMTLAAALAFAVPVAALATDNSGPQDDRHHPTELDKIEVSATPLADTAESLMLPVDVLAGERLDAVKANTLGETVSKLPGVQSSYFGPGVGRPIIRGFSGARVAVLSDGMSSGDVSTVSVDHAVSIEPFLADRIEVLKGPATLLYGSGAIGGAVNVVDGRVPESTTLEPFQGRAELRAGTVNDGRTGMLRFDGTLGDAPESGGLVFHFDAMHRDTDDYEIPGFAESEYLRELEHEHDGDAQQRDDEAFGVLPNSALRTTAGALGLSWIGERGFIGAAWSSFDTHYGIPGHTHEHEEGGHGHEVDSDHGAEEHEQGVTIGMEQHRGEIRGGLDRIGRFESLRVKLARTDYTHTEYEGAEIGTVFNNTSTEGRLELVHQPLAGWQGALGAQWTTRDFRAVGDEAFVPPSESRDAGMFWVGNRDFGAFKLQLGVRHDRIRINVIDTAAAASGELRPDRDFDTTSLSTALRWNLSDAFHVSLGLDRAQRAPTAEELHSAGLHVATSSVEIGNSSMDVETANRAELGLHWHAGALQFSASIYQARFDDFIYLAETGIEEDGLPVRLWTQHDASFRGTEAKLDWAFIENASGTWSLGLFGDLVRAELDGTGTRVASAIVPHEDHTHDYTVTLSNSGDLPRIVPARIGGELRWENAHWRAALGAVHYAEQDHVASNETVTPGYTLIDAHFAWHMDNADGVAWEVFLDGSNLLNEEARVHTSFLKDLAPLPGRSIEAGVRAFF